MGRTLQGYAPMNVLFVDLIELPNRVTENGHKFVLVVQCAFTRYAWSFPMKSKKGKDCTEMLQNKLFGPFGAPRVLVSDNGGGFVSEIVEAVLLMVGGSEVEAPHDRPVRGRFYQRSSFELGFD